METQSELFDLAMPFFANNSAEDPARDHVMDISASVFALPNELGMDQRELAETAGVLAEHDHENTFET